MSDITITTHKEQLTRIGDDMLLVCDDSDVFGQLKIFRWFLYTGELLTLGVGLFHLLHGVETIVIGAFCLELFLIMVHLIESAVENRLHINHERRVQSLRDELTDKEDDMLGIAQTYNMRVQRWYRRARRGY